MDALRVCDAIADAQTVRLRAAVDAHDWVAALESAKVIQMCVEFQARAHGIRPV